MDLLEPVKRKYINAIMLLLEYTYRTVYLKSLLR